MNDTRSDITVRFQNLMMSKSGEQRVLMGCSMYDTARQIVCSAILNQKPGITNEELKRQIFLRFYGLEFNEADRERILANFSKPTDA